QLARRLELDLGDTLALPTPQGQRQMEVVALYADYGNPRGHLLVDADWLRAHFPDARLTGLNLHVAAGSDSLQRELAQRFMLDGQRLVDQATIKRWSTEVFERTFAATGA